MTKQLITVKTYALNKRISVQHVYRLCRAGKLKHEIIDGVWFVDYSQSVTTRINETDGN